MVSDLQLTFANPLSPSPFDRPVLITQICARLAEGESLVRICREERMPNRNTLMRWCERYPEVGQQIARARLLGAEFLIEETLEIADDLGETPESRKVRIWARHEAVKRMHPERYGDRPSTITTNNTVNVVITEKQRERLMELRRASQALQ